MKKYLFLALAAIALTCISCEQKNNNGSGGGGDNEPTTPTINPKDVTAKDMVGEWRVDSTYFNDEIDPDGRYAIKVTLDTIYSIKGAIPYTVADGIITVTLEDYDFKTDQTTQREAHLEILTFDNVNKRASFKEADAKDYYGTDGVKMIYVTAYPVPTGKDLAVTEENIKGSWLIEYEEYRSGDQPLEKQVSPHWVFQVFGENHYYLDLLATNPRDYTDSYPHPGYWWFVDGEIAAMSTSKDFDEITLDEVTGGWYKVEKLTENFMIIHDSWDTGDSYKYMSRVPDVQLPE